MKKLTWKKKQYDDLTIWISEVKTVGWQFSIECSKKGYYEPFIYYGHSEDIPLICDGFLAHNLKEAKEICQRWLENTIINLNKWI